MAISSKSTTEFSSPILSGPKVLEIPRWSSEFARCFDHKVGGRPSRVDAVQTFADLVKLIKEKDQGLTASDRRRRKLRVNQGSYFRADAFSGDC
jgi:hypothetical protein